MGGARGVETLVVRQAHHEGLGTCPMHPVPTCTPSSPRRRGSSAPRRRREEALCGQDCPLLDSRLRGNDTVAPNPHLSPSNHEGFRTARATRLWIAAHHFPAQFSSAFSASSTDKRHSPPGVVDSISSIRQPSLSLTSVKTSVCRAPRFSTDTSTTA